MERRDSGGAMEGAAEEASGWVEGAARLGYAAKGVVYAVIGGLAVQQAFQGGGDTAGSREALQEIASGSLGKVALGVIVLGLVGYVVWRLVQAFLDPESDWRDDEEARWAKRAFYFISAVLYGILTYYGATLLFGSGGGSAGGSGGSGSGGGSSGFAAELLSMSWGRWILGAVGVGVIGRGLFQFWKAYTEKFKERISSFDLGPARRNWVVGASRVGLTARGVIFAIIGGSLAYAAVTHDPGRARGLEGALQVLTGSPWILGAVGVGLMCYAVYQWVKARYRLIGV